MWTTCWLLLIRLSRHNTHTNKPEPYCSRVFDSFYVDDLLTGADTPEQTQHTYQQTRALLLKGNWLFLCGRPVDWCWHAWAGTTHIPTNHSLIAQGYLTLSMWTTCWLVLIRLSRHNTHTNKPQPYCSRVFDSFYVDDLLTGADTPEQTQHTYQQTRALLLKGNWLFLCGRPVDWCWYAWAGTTHIPTNQSLIAQGYLTLSMWTTCWLVLIRLSRHNTHTNKPEPYCSRVFDSFYVDDLLTAADTPEQTQHTYQQTRALLLKGNWLFLCGRPVDWCWHAWAGTTHIPTNQSLIAQG